MERIQAVAKKFSEIIREWLTDEELEAVIEENKVSEEFCATHAFCDPNVAMAQAIAATTDYTEDDVANGLMRDASITLLWNDAWTMAAQAEFYR